MLITCPSSHTHTSPAPPFTPKGRHPNIHLRSLLSLHPRQAAENFFLAHRHLSLAAVQSGSTITESVGNNHPLPWTLLIPRPWPPRGEGREYVYISRSLEKTRKCTRWSINSGESTDSRRRGNPSCGPYKQNVCRNSPSQNSMSQALAISRLLLPPHPPHPNRTQTLKRDCGTTASCCATLGTNS